jgi:hypothetical protein
LFAEVLHPAGRGVAVGRDGPSTATIRANVTRLQRLIRSQYLPTIDEARRAYVDLADGSIDGSVLSHWYFGVNSNTHMLLCRMQWMY